MSPAPLSEAEQPYARWPLGRLADEVDRLAQERRAGTPGGEDLGTRGERLTLCHSPGGEWMAYVAVKPKGRSDRFESWVARGPRAALRGLLVRVRRIEVRSWT